MKNSDIRNLRVLAASLCLSTTLLTGCSENAGGLTFGDSVIIYEEEKIKGTISYEDLNIYTKIVTVEQNGTTSQLLLLKGQNCVIQKYSDPCILVSYVDLKTGENIIEYHDYSKEARIWITGENLNIIEEQDITGYLLQEDFIKKEYEVSEVLTFFEETIKPTLNGNEKEMVK